MSEQEKEPLMITPGGGAFPFAVVGKIEQAEQEPVACKTVPVEPTEDMLLAAELSQQRGYRELYGAMINAAPIEPVKQEPIGNISLWHNHGYQNHNVEYYGTLPDGLHQLYAAPVRTKDLTDEEICRMWNDWHDVVGAGEFALIARAVIEKFKEKNRG